MELLILIILLLLIFNSCEQPKPNPELVCPHCNVKGKVFTQSVKRKKGISGAKATGAVFTCGLSMLATGLSRKEEMTKAACKNCGSVWYY
jgi:hypothetical protein